MRPFYAEWMKCKKSPFFWGGIITYALCGLLSAGYLAVVTRANALLDVMDIISAALPFTIAFNSFFIMEMEESEYRYYSFFVMPHKSKILMLKIIFALILVLVQLLSFTVSLTVLSFCLNIAMLPFGSLLVLFLGELFLSLPLILVSLYLALNQSLLAHLFFASFNTFLILVFANITDFTRTRFFPWSWAHINNVYTITVNAADSNTLFLIYRLCGILIVLSLSIFICWFVKWEGERKE